MIGTTHALTGAACWLALGTAARLIDVHPSAAMLIFGTAAAAGAALLPDVDLDRTTAARTFGNVSEVACKAIGSLCARVYRATRGAHDDPATNGHRTLTHTFAATLAAGVLAAALVALFGAAGVAIVAFVTAAPLVRLIVPRWHGGFAVFLLAAGFAMAAGVFGAQVAWWVYGVAVLIGWLSHCLTDALTRCGAPLLWPLPVQPGRRWHVIALPKRFRLTVGGPTELLAIIPALLFGVFVLLLGLVA